MEILEWQRGREKRGKNFCRSERGMRERTVWMQLWKKEDSGYNITKNIGK